MTSPAQRGPLRIEVVPLVAVPSLWDDAWAQLATAASEPNPFAESWFMRPALRNLAMQADDRMMAVWHGDDLVGMLPITRTSRYGRLPVPHVQNWMHFHCFFGAPLVRAGFETIFWRAVLETLDGAAWADSFLHLVGLDPMGPLFAGLRDTRRTDVVHHRQRAMLRSELSAEAYYNTNVRPKRRKELRRLRKRLDDQGRVEFSTLAADGPVDDWIHNFLSLEASGWKGRVGSALSSHATTSGFFKEAVTAAHRAEKSELLRLTVDGKPIAMLVSFVTPPGRYAFKIAFDEGYARFSPGVLLSIENLRSLNRPDVEWTDSCAAENHAMINSLWAERRAIIRVTVPLAGLRRRTIFHAARGIEILAAQLRSR